MLYCYVTLTRLKTLTFCKFFSQAALQFSKSNQIIKITFIYTAQSSRTFCTHTKKKNLWGKNDRVIKVYRIFFVGIWLWIILQLTYNMLLLLSVVVVVILLVVFVLQNPLGEPLQYQFCIILITQKGLTEQKLNLLFQFGLSISICVSPILNMHEVTVERQDSLKPKRRKRNQRKSWLELQLKLVKFQ